MSLRRRPMAAVLYSLRGGRGFDLKSNIKVTWRKGALLAHIDLSRCGQRPSRANRDIGALAVRAPAIRPAATSARKSDLKLDEVPNDLSTFLR